MLERVNGPSPTSLRGNINKSIFQRTDKHGRKTYKNILSLGICHFSEHNYLKDIFALVIQHECEASAILDLKGKAP